MLRGRNGSRGRGTTTRSGRRARRLAVVLSLAATAVLAADLVTLSPENYAAFAPTGKEADCIFGDYVLRNDRIVAAVADPTLLMGRSAGRWSIGSVAGALIDLTFRHDPNDQLTAYYPAVVRFKPDAPNTQAELLDESETHKRPGREPRTGRRVTLSLPPYEVGSRKMLAELATLPAYLRGAPKPWVQVDYTLEDGWPYVLVKTTYTNPTAESVTITPVTSLRVDGDVRSYSGHEDRLFAVHNPWWGQAYGLLADGHTLEASRARRPRHPLRHVAADDKPIVLPPHGSYGVARRIFPGGDLFAVKATAADLLGIRQHEERILVTAPDGPVAGAEVVAERDGRVYGAGRTDPRGTLDTRLPAGTYEISVTASGRPLRQASLRVPGGETIVQLGPAGTVTITTHDERGRALPCKVALRGRDGTPDPFFFPETGERRVRNVIYAHDGRVSQALTPGNYEIVVTYGPEYDAVVGPVTVVPGHDVAVAAVLRRVVDTSGWISADLHNHSTLSSAEEIFYVYPYSACPSVNGSSWSSTRGRVLGLLCSQVEFAVPTEHNFITSYEPLLAELGASHLMATCPGIGLTAGRRHTLTHQNVFPVIHTPGRQDGGALQRPEHIRQLEWMLDWDDGADKLVQIAFPQSEGLAIRRGMDLLDVQRLEPLVDGAPIPGHDNRVLDWVGKLNEGYRIPGVFNSAPFGNFGGRDGVRNYVRNAATVPSDIDPLDIVREARAGRVIMTTAPFVEARLQADGATGISGDLVRAPGGKVKLLVRVQASNWCRVDRVQVLVNGGRPEALDLRREAGAKGFGEGVVQFEREIPLQLDGDSHLIVVVSGMGPDLSPGGKDGTEVQHVAVANPIHVDTDGGGFAPHSPLDDKVDARIEFVEAPLAALNAEPGRVRLTLTNRGEEPCEDTATLEAMPGGACQIIGPVTQPYVLPHIYAETTIDWQFVFTDKYILEQVPMKSNYNLARTFAVRVPRSGKYPGRRATGRWMAVDHRAGSLPPLASVSDVAAALAGEIAYPVRVRGRDKRLADARLGVSGQDLALYVEVTERELKRAPVVWEGSCVEIFGAMPGRIDLPGQAPGGYYPIHQVFLAPAVGARAGAAFYRRDGEIVAAPGIRLATSLTGNGYALSALVPLPLLGIEVDTIVRDVRLHGNSTPVSRMAGAARAGRFLWEARVTTVDRKKGKRERGTVFGSPAPHVDHLGFGRMRMRRNVTCELDILRTLSVAPGAEMARVRVRLQNITDTRVADSISLLAEPGHLVEVQGPGDVSFDLAPGEKLAREFDIALRADALGSQVYLVVPRSPKGIVVGTPSPRLEIADWPIRRLAPTAPAGIKAALAGERGYGIRIEGSEVATIRLGIAADNLIVHARVTDPEVLQHARPWKGSDLEVFGAMPGRDEVGQVFLLPGDGKSPPRALLSRAGKQVATDKVTVHSQVVPGGYELSASIPLGFLEIDANAGDIKLELQVSNPIGAGKRRYGTVFGTKLAYLGSQTYGRFSVTGVAGD